MAIRISLRKRLVIWYSIIVAFSLLLFGIYTYLSFSAVLYSNLDTTLSRVASSLDYIMKESQQNPKDKVKTTEKKSRSQKSDKFALFREEERKRFVGPLRPTVSPRDELYEKQDIVWSAIYEHILLNSKNYYIQIADTNEQIIWRSNNLLPDSLPIYSKLTHLLNFIPDTATKSIKKQDSLSINEQKILPDSAFFNIVIDNKNVRLLVKKSKQALISIGYNLEDIEDNIKNLYSILIIAFPPILLISIIGGLILSKLSLKQINEITRTAEEITAKHLSKRLPVVHTNDEVGHLTRTLNEMIERLEGSFNQIRRFTADASHELRTPLTILRGELEIALHKVQSIEEYQMIILSSLEEVERLSNVVDTLLELSRADAGQVKMVFQESDLSKLILDISEDAEILAEAKGLILHKDIENKVFVQCDTARIHQAVLNVIDNAIKYTPKGGSITIKLKKHREYSEIIISDTGIGIPEEHIPFIFDRFYRIDKARSKNIQGSGLGLAIVKWIIDSHNGSIEIQNKSQGTILTIKLPNKRTKELQS